MNDFNKSDFFNLAFQETKIKSLTMKNRFIRSATWMASVEENGFVNDETLSIYKKLADNNLGLIITGCSLVNKQNEHIRMMNISSDVYLDSLRKLTELVHKFNSKIAIQLYHDILPVYSGNRLVIKKEALPIHVFREKINEIVEKFGLATQRAVKVGFDAIEIHAAHGYFLSRFLSPLFNKRSDEYGGSLENRTRILVEIIKKIRENVGNEYPIIVKINSEENGKAVKDLVEIVKTLERSGVDLIELSGGNNVKFELSGKIYFLDSMEPYARKDVDSIEKEAYFLQNAMEIKKEVNIPIILVGGIRSPEMVYHILKNKYADYIGLSRPLIAEPNLITKWKNGDLGKAKCLSCNSCFDIEFREIVACKRY